MGENSHMIEKFYSKVYPNKLLHIVHRLETVSKRVNIIPEEHFLQCSFMCLEKNQTFKPHKHIEKNRSYPNQIAQESWIVIKGKIKSIFYDIDDSILREVILNPGDASFTLYGGHNYIILEPDTVVYEYKTGPYEGIEFDKIFIGE
jgi:cupin fold WbuC family metalloprotein